MKKSWSSLQTTEIVTFSKYTVKIRTSRIIALIILKWAASWQNQQNGMCAQRRLRSAWASAQSDQSSLSAWRKIGSLATQWAHSEDSDQIGRMPRLIWVFAGRTDHLVGFVMRWLKFEQCHFTIEYLHPKDDRMANSVDPDQTASSAAVWSVSTLFAQRSSLIWVYPVCQDLSVQKLRLIVVINWASSSENLSSCSLTR